MITVTKWIKEMKKKIVVLIEVKSNINGKNKFILNLFYNESALNLNI